MRYENLLLVILYCGYGCRVPKAIMVIMIDLMLEVSNVSMRLTVSAINPALLVSCLAQCIRYLRYCVKYISSIFKLNELSC